MAKVTTRAPNTLERADSGPARNQIRFCCLQKTAQNALLA